MISPFAVERFLERPLRNSDETKALAEDIIDQKLADISGGYQPITALRLHQKVAMLLGLRRAYLFFLKMGLGKTCISLNIARCLKQQKKITRSLVLVPNLSNVYGWVKEVKKHTPDLSVEGLDNPERSIREEQMLSGADLTVITYQGWNAFICDLEDAEDVDDPDRKERVIVPKQAKKYEPLFQNVIYDEIPAAKNHRSLTYKVCKRLSKQCSWKYGLTGTPFGKNVQDIWAQFMLIDGGETLGSTLGMFRACFFIEKEDYWKGIKYEFDGGKKELLNRVIRNRSVYYSSEECLDLPAKTYVTREYSLTQEQRAFYDAAIKKVRVAEGDYSLIKDSWHRLRSVCSGWSGAVSEDGERVDFELKENPKLDVLMEILDEIGIDEKVLVFNWYVHTGDILEKTFKAAKIGHVRLYSGTKDRGDIQSKFDNDPDCRVFLSSSAGAKGLNLQVARYVILFEGAQSPDQYEQMTDRVWRMEQKRKVFVYDLVGRRTIEERNLNALKAGKALFDEVMAGREKLE